MHSKLFLMTRDVLKAILLMQRPINNRVHKRKCNMMTSNEFSTTSNCDLIYQRFKVALILDF